MNRRDFFKQSLYLLALPFIPKIESDEVPVRWQEKIGEADSRNDIIHKDAFESTVIDWEYHPKLIHCIGDCRFRCEENNCPGISKKYHQSENKVRTVEYYHGEHLIYFYAEPENHTIFIDCYDAIIDENGTILLPMDLIVEESNWGNVVCCGGEFQEKIGESDKHPFDIESTRADLYFLHNRKLAARMKSLDWQIQQDEIRTKNITEIVDNFKSNPSNWQCIKY